METALQDIGLNEKEIKLYLELLEHTSLTAALIAKKISESRTNTYMLLESLSEKGIVEADETKPVKEFVAAPPSKLRSIVLSRQEELKQADASLRSILPELNSKYHLAQHKPGVIYREGLEGLRDVLEDMAKSDEEILLIPSNMAPDHSEAFVMLKKATVKRKARGIPTRALMDENGRNWPVMKLWPKQGIETRFMGDTPYDGEIIIYGNTCVFITYVPELITTVLTNTTIAVTMKQLFEQLWQTAKP